MRAWPQSLDDLPALPAASAAARQQQRGGSGGAPPPPPELVQLPGGSGIANPAPRPPAHRSKTWFWPSGTFPEEEPAAAPSRNGSLHHHLGNGRH